MRIQGTKVGDVDELRAGGGSLRLEGTRLYALGPSGAPARAGDGLAAALAHAATTGDITGLAVSVGTLAAIPAGTHRAGIGASAVETAIPVDQTHLSMIVTGVDDTAVVVKLVSEWGAADRAARLQGSLTAAGSTDVPEFRGRLDWIHPVLGVSTVALVSELLPNSEDGWTWAVEDVLAHLRDGAVTPTWPARVGALTARLHVALAADAAPASDDAPTTWRSRANEALEQAVLLTTGTAGTRLTNRAAAMRAVIAAMPADTTSPVFSGHGDLHVGQLLRSEDRYWVLDFDGDPQLTRADRDRLEPAARDLAHLLVSVDQVGCVAQRRAGGADPAYPAWAASARHSLQATYTATLADLGRPDLLDARFVAGLEAEQMARELIYAARFLPRWTYAGDGIVVARFPAAPDTKEEPWTPPASAPTSS